MAYNLSDHSVPSPVLVLGAVRAVLYRTNLVVEADQLGDLRRQVDAEALVLLDSIAVLVGSHSRYQVRLVLTQNR